MSERNDCVRAMLTAEWQWQKSIIDRCCEMGLYADRRHAYSAFNKIFRSLEKGGLGERKHEGGKVFVRLIP